MLVFADEPDIAIYQDGLPWIAVEVKGGIDEAGVLERIGAALKSLRRIRQENPDAITILIIQELAMTKKAHHDLKLHADTVSLIFSASEVVEDERQRERLFFAMRI